MTGPQQVASTAKVEASHVAGTAADQASQVAGAAGSAGSEVLATAKDEAANVVGEAIDQAKDLTETVRAQLADQVTAQGERLTAGLRALGTQLVEGDTSGVVGQVLKEAGQRVQTLAEFTDRTGPSGLADEVRRYARRNPGTFLLGAALAGLVGGRIMKGVAAQKQQAQRSELPAVPARGYSPALGGTATGQPLAGVTAPVGTGARAGYVPAAEPDRSYAPEPYEAYPAAPERSDLYAPERSAAYPPAPDPLERREAYPPAPVAPGLEDPATEVLRSTPPGGFVPGRPA